jgi:putative oxygen-independent coproporphyrinogen III oxidase
VAGIYIHVPFCSQACRYCDFYFTVSLKYRDAYVEALLRELADRAGELTGSDVSTVYLGGGTPSVLTGEQLEEIMLRVREMFHIDPAAEVTIEANPDDLDDARLALLQAAGFNRLSIGVQSFHAHHLELMRRSHNAAQASDAILRAAGHGFDNINMDLIYGLPGLTSAEWEQNVLTTMDLPVQHISAYHLTYEPGTVFDHWRKKGRIRELPEGASIMQYKMLREITGSHGFEHYEISNFALPGYRSAHNSSYWSGTPYAGFGPSAHSYNGTDRRWNIASLQRYIESSLSGGTAFEKETLTTRDRFHDYLITVLRTMEGANLVLVREQFGDRVTDQLLQRAELFTGTSELKMEGDRLKMTPEGWLRSDMVIQALMLE